MQDNFKAVLIGCGGITGAWFGAINDVGGVTVTALVDLSIEQAEALKEKQGLGDVLVTTSLAEAIERTSPDVVFDCTVPSAHYDVTTTALTKGCHVLGEKPMAESMAEAKQMVAAAQQAGKLYAVIQNRRYLDVLVNFKEALASSSMGALTTLNADFYIGAHFGGFREAMQHPLLLDMAIHSFDSARHISGCDPVSVYCHSWNPAGSWYGHHASAMAIFEMSKGVVFNYRGSWCSEGLNTSWQCDWRAVCRQGTICCDGENTIRMASVGSPPEPPEGLFHSEQELTAPSAELQYRQHGGVLNDFLDSLRNHTEPQTVCGDNIKSLAMVHAAIESAETGRKVQISY